MFFGVDFSAREVAFVVTWACPKYSRAPRDAQIYRSGCDNNMWIIVGAQQPLRGIGMSVLALEMTLF